MSEPKRQCGRFSVPAAHQRRAANLFRELLAIAAIRFGYGFVCGGR
jgi:hypothetical protein